MLLHKSVVSNSNKNPFNILVASYLRKWECKYKTHHTVDCIVIAIFLWKTKLLQKQNLKVFGDGCTIYINKAVGQEEHMNF